MPTQQDATRLPPLQKTSLNTNVRAFYLEPDIPFLDMQQVCHTVSKQFRSVQTKKAEFKNWTHSCGIFVKN